MAGHTSRDFLLNDTQQVFTAASPVDQAVSENFRVSDEASLALTVRILTGPTTAVGTTTGKLQSSFDGKSWVDHGTVSITTKNTYYYIHHNCYAGTDTPLAPKARVVVSGTTVTVDIAEVKATQRP